MNSFVYIFGRLGNGYTQYPDDYAKEIYQNLYEKSNAQSQLVIHRDNNLMYYGYIRKLDIDSQYIGFCVLLNGIMFSNIGLLFPIFEDAIDNLVTHGEILQFSDKGEIFSATDNLAEQQKEVERISSFIQNGIDNLNEFTRELPPVNYSIAKDESKTFLESDNDQDVVEASYQYGYTFVLNDNDCNTANLTSCKSIILRLNQEKEELDSNYKELKNKYDKLSEQKKQYKKVIILFVILVLCAVGLSALMYSLSQTNRSLSHARRNIDQKEETIEEMDEEIDDLKSSLASANTRCEESESKYNDLKSSVEDYLPIIITDFQVANVYNDGTFETDYGGTIYSSYSMFLKPKITYEGVKTGESITLDIKLYTPSGLSRGNSSPSNCSWSESMSVYSGSNTQTFQHWGGPTKGHWSSGTYRYEIWYNNTCLRSKSFTVY